MRYTTKDRRGFLKLGALFSGAALVSQNSAAALPANQGDPKGSTEIEPFHLGISQEQLRDLQDRLARTRWPEAETVGDTSQGAQLAKMRALMDYWQNGYDWRRCEALLNGFGQFKTNIDGLDIHFLHIRSPEPDALPLLMCHGWPGSVLEFRKVIGPLTDPAKYGADPRKAFHLVIPSMPGFGFSGKPTTTAWTMPHIADAWMTLMGRLGYEKWGAQGGDFGTPVIDTIAGQKPKQLIGFHMNFVRITLTPDEIASATPKEREMLASEKDFWDSQSGYLKEQTTRPQTIGYSLADSPVGLASWIYTFFQDSCGTPGNVEATFTRDEMLDNIMLYWLPDTGASSARLYWQTSHWQSPATPAHQTSVPAGFSMFPKDAHRKSRRQLEACYSDVVFFNEPANGGHFAALEQPEVLIADVRATFETLR